jgi:type IV fimbrial biogenesis protein FimT
MKPPPLSLRKRPGAGLTLVELAVAIALLALLATLGTPHFADLLAKHRLRGAGETLLADLSEARFAAAQRGQPIHVNFRTGTPWCWAVANNANCDCQVPQSCRIKASTDKDHPGVSLTNTVDARFEPDGMGSGKAELHSNRGHQLRIEIGPTGRARLCSPGATDARYPAC